MLSAVLEDFARIPGVEVMSLLHEGHDLGGEGRPWQWVRAAREEPAFRDLARSSDFTLVIAPEFDDLLLTRCRWVKEAGGRLMGPDLEAIRLTGDKAAVARYLPWHGVPTPECRPFAPDLPVPPLPFPLVCKPRHGAGSIATFLVRTPDQWSRFAERAREEGPERECVVQPFVPGQPASVAWLVGHKQAVPLLPATQELSDDGRLHYRGCRLPLPSPLAERALRLTRRAVDVVPGLCGYVGVDLVLGEASDGGEDWVIEINPRLTSSYVGLRVLARSNLADAMLRAASGDEIPSLSWRPGSLRFFV
jgi:predicted ATP-grasp superfamily ATP-dependent carboligase